eukprot:c968_g1_i1 orf=296-1228(-)
MGEFCPVTAMRSFSYISLFISISLLECFLSPICTLAGGNLAYPGAFGDPHFTGWDGVNFDFTGEPGTIYCMLSDSTLHINMKLDGQVTDLGVGPQTQTWIKSLGILYRTHRIVMSAAQGPDLSHKNSFLEAIEADGMEVNLEPGGKYNSSDGTVTLSYNRRKNHKVLPYDRYTLSLADEAKVRITVRPEIPDLRTEHDAFFHLSVEIMHAKLTPEVHGVLGQTLLNAGGRLHGGSYHTVWNSLLLVQQVDGPNGDGYLDGSVSDYVSSGLLHSDCRFSRFDSNADNGIPRVVKVSSGYSRKVFPGSLRYY